MTIQTQLGWDSKPIEEKLKPIAIKLRERSILSLRIKPYATGKSSEDKLWTLVRKKFKLKKYDSFIQQP